MFQPIRSLFLILTCFFFFGCIGTSKEVSLKTLQTTPPIPVSEHNDESTDIKNGRFVSNEGRFSIKIPELPFSTVNGTPNRFNKEGDLYGKQYVWRFEYTSYTAMYSPLNSDKNKPQEQILEEMGSGIRKGLKNRSGEFISEKPITIGKHPGFEIRSVGAEGIKSIHRSYLTSETGYLLMGNYLRESDEKVVIEVLDSFRLHLDED